MTLFQVLILLFIGLILSKIFKRYQEKIISVREIVFWFLIWLMAAGFTLWPGTTSFLARSLGVGRGVDLVVYCGLILILYLLFKIMIRIERLERNTTSIVRQIAIEKPVSRGATALTPDFKGDKDGAKQ